MSGLKIVLWLTGVICLCGFIGIILPWSIIAKLASISNWDVSGFQGCEKYVVRIAMAAFGMIGVFFLILARDPLKYGIMLSLAGYGLLVFGLICLVWGIYYRLTGFPWWSWLGDVLFCLITGGLIVYFKGKEQETSV